MTRESIAEEIDYLEDDNAILTNIINSKDASFIEKAECRSKHRANSREITRLKCLLISINSDPLFK